MRIEKIMIENFKGFKERFSLNISDGANIVVGNNEAGKSTILEAIHLALTGFLNGRYLRNELTQYLFNNEAVNEYLNALKNGTYVEPPFILIEIYFSNSELPLFEGNDNTDKTKACGLSFKVCFDDKYQKEYESLIKRGEVKTLPIEYYDIEWRSFARDNITARGIPIKSAMIDSSVNRYKNGSDVYISQIVKNNLEPEEVVDISQAHRRMREKFMSEESIKAINEKIKHYDKISEKDMELSVDLVSKNAWENSLMTYADQVPFHYIGKGEQSIIKTQLALSHKKSKEANIILIEEPENHLSHAKLNQFLNSINKSHKDKQIIISTHSSFVANKLGLDNIVLLNNKKTTRFNDLLAETKQFFEKVSGYDTLRLILCNKAILVEGDSDELIVQKAYMQFNNGKLPIDDGIDVLSVGTSFLRFLEIAAKINKPVSVVTDNDGDPEAVKRKYKNYLDDDLYEHINICFDEKIDTGDLKINSKLFNYNTLEPKLLKENSLEKFNEIFGTSYSEEEELQKYMKSNKTDCALKIFNTEEKIIFPDYILEAINCYG